QTEGDEAVACAEAIDIRAGAADPAAFHHGSPVPGVRHMPGQIFAALATAKNEDIKPFRLGDAYLLRVPHPTGPLTCQCSLYSPAPDLLANGRGPTVHGADAQRPRPVRLGPCRLLGRRRARRHQS